MRNKLQPYLFWILLAFLAVGFVYPAIGLVAIVCMLAPVIIAPFKGRFWCGNWCPRGSFYDHALARLSPKRPIPPFFRSKGLRVFMLAFIMTVFSVQTYYAWGDLAAMGLVFINLIFVTTVVGVILGAVVRVLPDGDAGVVAEPRGDAAEGGAELRELRAVREGLPAAASAAARQGGGDVHGRRLPEVRPLHGGVPEEGAGVRGLGNQKTWLPRGLQMQGAPDKQTHNALALM